MDATALLPVAQWSALVGVFTPMLVAVVNRSHWLSWVKAVVALLTCLVTGTVTAWLAGDLSFTEWGTAVLVVLLASATMYKQFWKDSTITDKIEEATTPS